MTDNDELKGLLADSKGMCIRQISQNGEAAQVLAVPYERKNLYKVGKLPEGKKVGEWQPTATDLERMEADFMVLEDSALCTRTLLTFLGCKNLRPLKWHFAVEGRDVYIADRPFNCGGWICCPFTSTLHSGPTTDSRPIGMIKEDFDNYFSKCFESCCLCTGYTDVYEADEKTNEFSKLYTLKINRCCANGGRFNFCGATCLKQDMVFEILNAKTGEHVATLQKTYGGNGFSSVFRCCFDFDNYVLEFPPDSTPEQRLLLLTAIMNVEYQFFENAGQ